MTEALGDDLHRHAVGRQQGGVGVAEVGPDHRRQVLPRAVQAYLDLSTAVITPRAARWRYRWDTRPRTTRIR